MNEASGAAMEEVSSDDLRSALERALSGHFGTSRKITRLERAPCAFSSSFRLEQLSVELDEGGRLDLMFKDLGEEGLSERARAAKPPFLYDPLREIETYRSILAPAMLGTATFYGAAVDPTHGRYWLFIENVPGVALWQIGDFDVWESVASWASALHGRFAGEDPAARHLLRYDADLYRMWINRAVEFADRWEARRPGVARKGIEWLASRYDVVVERLTALPTTFIHGELYASNVLMVKDGDGSRVCPIDWEIAALGPGLIDLAALATGWQMPERTALADAYRDAHPHKERLPDRETFLEDLACGLLHLAVQWLGWAPDWRPPRSHRRDWVGDALGFAEELGL